MLLSWPDHPATAKNSRHCTGAITTIATTRGGPKEVGSSTTGAVVMILVSVSLVDVVLTQLLFGE